MTGSGGADAEAPHGELDLPAGGNRDGDGETVPSPRPRRSFRDVPPAPPDFEKLCHDIGVHLSPVQLSRCQRYLELLMAVNGCFRVTIADPHRAWFRHILDSLTLVPLLPATVELLDIGTGPGLPGIPLAIALPAAHITLNERRGKAAAWLSRTCQELELQNVSVVTGRVQEMDTPVHRERYETVVVRRLGTLAELLTWTHPLLRPGGQLVAMKGRRAEKEIGDAEALIRELQWAAPTVHQTFVGTENAATLVQCTKPAVPTEAEAALPPPPSPTTNSDAPPPQPTARSASPGTC